MTERRSAARDLTVCGLFAALVAAGAFMRVTIPMQPMEMHFTMQWFFVLLAGLLLKPRQALASVCTYLAVGLVGVPVFAAGGGPAYLVRPTFGFLLGFALAAWVIACSRERLHTGKPLAMMISASLGLFVYYGVGMLYYYFIYHIVLGTPVGWQVVLVNCFFLTIGEDFILCVLAVLVAVRLRPTLGRILAMG